MMRGIEVVPTVRAKIMTYVDHLVWTPTPFGDRRRKEKRAAEILNRGFLDGAALTRAIEFAERHIADDLARTQR